MAHPRSSLASRSVRSVFPRFPAHGDHVRPKAREWEDVETHSVGDLV